MIQNFENTMNIVRDLAKRTNKQTVLIFLQHTREEDIDVRTPAVRESISNIICFVSLGSTEHIPMIIDRAKGTIDKIVIDTDLKRTNSYQIRMCIEENALKNNISVAYYSDYASWVTSATNFMFAANSDIHAKNILLIGRNALATRMLLDLIERQISVYVLAEEYQNSSIPFDISTSISIDSPLIKRISAKDLHQFPIDILLGCSLLTTSPMLMFLQSMRFETVYDIGIGNFSKEFIEKQRASGAKCYRSDDRAGIAGTIINIMETDYLVKNNLTRVLVGDMTLVSGGCIGSEGDLVVDNANNPQVVMGVAAGDGTFKCNLSIEDKSNIEKINKLIR